jgi:hypothetical protein
MPHSTTGARRPILSASVIDSLEALVTSTPANDATEAGLRYLRRLVAYERRPETVAHRAEISRKVQQAKLDRKRKTSLEDR